MSKLPFNLKLKNNVFIEVSSQLIPGKIFVPVYFLSSNNNYYSQIFCRLFKLGLTLAYDYIFLLCKKSKLN